MTCSTRSRTVGRTLGWLLSTRETVERETSARVAMCSMVSTGWKRSRALSRLPARPPSRLPFVAGSARQSRVSGVSWERSQPIRAIVGAASSGCQSPSLDPQRTLANAFLTGRFQVEFVNADDIAQAAVRWHASSGSRRGRAEDARADERTRTAEQNHSLFEMTLAARVYQRWDGPN